MTQQAAVAHTPQDSLSRTWLLIGGLVLAVGYLALGVVLDAGPIPDMHSAQRVALGIVLVAVVALHGWLVHSLWRSRAGASILPLIAMFGLGYVLILSWHQPAFTDVYSYIGYGRLVAVHGVNPMVVAPDAFPSDPYLSLISPGYRNAVSVYGPGWNLIGGAAVAIAEAGGGGSATYVLVFRVLVIAGYLACVVLLWSVLGLWKPELRTPGTVLFAWSPLVVIETAAVHNDLVMVALVLAGLRLVVLKRTYWAVAVLTLACLVKLYASVVALLVVVALVARVHGGLPRLRVAFGYVATAVLCALPWYLVFGDVVRSLLSPFSADAGASYNSFAELITAVVARSLAVLGTSADPTIVSLSVRWFGQVVAIAVLVVLAVRTWRARTLEFAVTASVAGLMAVLLLSARFWPWYAVVVVALAPLASPIVRSAAVILGYSSLGIYALYPLPTGPTAVGFARSIVVAAPVVAAAAWRLRHHRTDPAPEPPAELIHRSTTTGD